MKLARLSLLVAAIAGVVAAIALAALYLERNSVARGIANRMLAGSGLSVVGVDLGRLGTARVVFDRLELVGAGGTRIRVQGLELPISFPGLEPDYVAVARVTIEPAANGGEPAPLTPALRAVLQLPERLPATAVTVGRLDYADLPALTDVVWNLADRLQRLHFAAADHAVTAEVRRADSATHSGELDITRRGGEPALSLELTVSDGDDGLRVDGSGRLESAALAALPAVAGRLPAAVAGVQGSLDLTLGLTIDRQAAGEIAATLGLATETGLRIDSRVAGGSRFAGRIPSRRPAQLELTLPGPRWSVGAAEMSWTTDYPGLEALPIRVGGLRCEDDGRCRLTLDAGPGALELGGLAVERLALTLPLALELGDPARAELSHDPTVLLSGLSFGGATAGSVASPGAGEARLTLADGAVAATIGSLTLNVTNLEAAGVGIDALTVRLDEMRLAGGELAAEFSLDGAGGSPAAAAVATQDLASGQGGMKLTAGRWDFAERRLSRVVTGLPAGLDVVGGRAGFDAGIDWQPGAGAPRLTGRFEIELDDLAAHYGEIAAAGIRGTLRGTVGDDGVAIEPSPLRAALVDAGLELENLGFDLALGTDRVFAIDDLAFELLGGRVTAAPIRYDPTAEANTVTVRPESIQLALMAELAGFESLEVEGSISGTVPVQIENGQITVDDGRLANEAPGGVIRFDAGDAALAGQPNVALASRALGNFHFDSLESRVAYEPDGDLVLEMRLAGTNPDLDPNQPVILNLNVENNIPELLRSLQALRSIEEVLERRARSQ